MLTDERLSEWIAECERTPWFDKIPKNANQGQLGDVLSELLALRKKLAAIGEVATLDTATGFR